MGLKLGRVANVVTIWGMMKCLPDFSIDYAIE